MTKELRIKKKLFRILATNRMKKKLREKQMRIAIKFHAIEAPGSRYRSSIVSNWVKQILLKTRAFVNNLPAR